MPWLFGSSKFRSQAGPLDAYDYLLPRCCVEGSEGEGVGGGDGDIGERR
jgi:hypothetical protein